MSYRSPRPPLWIVLLLKMCLAVVLGVILWTVWQSQSYETMVFVALLMLLMNTLGD